MNLVRLGAFAAVTGAVLGLALRVGPRALARFRRRRSARGIARFGHALGHARRRQSRLNSLAWSTGRPDVTLDGIPLLSEPGWILPHPVPLAEVRIAMVDPPHAGPLEESRRRARALLPHRAGGGRYAGYGQALVELGGMGHLFDGDIYRPVEVRCGAAGMEIDFCMAGYFDYLDTSSVLGYELARDDLDAKGPAAAGAYRRYLADPFDLRRRSTGLGVNTLTIRRGRHGSGFFLHRRDVRFVTEATDVVHVVPAGDFAPVGGASHLEDFVLWRHIRREYVEEFLDLDEEVATTTGPFHELDRAHGEGRVSAHVFGIGLDPLTWKPSLLTACVFDAEVFDDLFGDYVIRAKEGTMLAGEDRTGIPFTEDLVERHASGSATIASAASCLRLAWRHREHLGLVHR